MNKRTLGLVILILILFEVGLPPAWGEAQADHSKAYTWSDKLKRGAINIVTSPVEVARDIHNTTQEKNLLLGWTIGLVTGLGNGLVRFGAGAIDLLTFPFNFPESRKAPLIEPEFVWEKPGPKYI